MSPATIEPLKYYIYDSTLEVHNKITLKAPRLGSVLFPLPRQRVFFYAFIQQVAQRTRKRR